MIDLASEQLLTLPQAAARLPRRPHASTLYRWVGHGVRGVRLGSIKMGGVVYTSIEAMQRFGEALSDGGDDAANQLSAKRRAARADGELAKAGL